MEIVPALLESNKEEFKEKLNKLVGFATRIQVDFNDGSFEEFVSVKPEEIESSILEWKDKINFEAHLMVQRPYDFVPKLVESGFKKIIVQFEIESNIREVLEQLRLENVLVGLAVGPKTTTEEIEPFGELIDTAIIMTVEPGKQGQKFLLEELAKISELRGGNFPGEIQVDGGIDDQTIEDVVAVMPDTLIIGGYIVNCLNPKGNYETLWKYLR